MRRFLRYVRIALSVTCGIACVLLIVLWVRSYWRVDQLNSTNQRRLTTVTSNYGELQLLTLTESDLTFVKKWGSPTPQYSAFGFSLTLGGELFRVTAPSWF